MRGHRFGKTTWLVLGAMLLGALAWAAAELAGQANMLAQEAGLNSLGIETVTLAVVRKPVRTKASPKPPPCDWLLERGLRHEIENADAEYQKALDALSREREEQGAVGVETAKRVLDLAAETARKQLAYADMWAACNCRTRARLAREAAETRLAGAEVAVSAVAEAAKLDRLWQSQDRLREARREYAITALMDGELSTEDRGDIRANLVPRARTVHDTVAAWRGRVEDLTRELQRQLTGGGACGAQSAAPRIRVILIAAVSMMDSAVALVEDVEALGGGTAPDAWSAPESRDAPCFYGASAP